MFHVYAASLRNEYKSKLFCPRIFLLKEGIKINQYLFQTMITRLIWHFILQRLKRAAQGQLPVVTKLRLIQYISNRDYSLNLAFNVAASKTSCAGATPCGQVYYLCHLLRK